MKVQDINKTTNTTQATKKAPANTKGKSFFISTKTKAPTKKESQKVKATVIAYTDDEKAFFKGVRTVRLSIEAALKSGFLLSKILEVQKDSQIYKLRFPNSNCVAHGVSLRINENFEIIEIVAVRGKGMKSEGELVNGRIWFNVDKDKLTVMQYITKTVKLLILKQKFNK